MTHKCGALSVVGPVIACHVCHDRALSRRAGQDVVHVGIIATTVHRRTRLGQPGLLVDVVRVAVKGINVLCDPFAFGVVPGADPMRSRAFSELALRYARQSFAGTGGLGKLLTVAIGAFEPGQIGAIARTLAGDKKAHAGVLGKRGRKTHRENGGRSGKFCKLFHRWSTPRC